MRMSNGRVVTLRPRAARAARLPLPLQTARLKLRDYRPEDFEAMCRYVCDPRVTRFLFLGPRDAEEAEQYLRRIIGYQKERPRTAWELALEETGSGRQVGGCNLTMIGPGEADLGYMLHHDLWGRGLATEVACALRDAAFRELALERVISTVDVRNAASIHVLEKAGFRWEATLRRCRQARGQWRDCHLFALPRIVWESRAAQRD